MTRGKMDVLRDMAKADPAFTERPELHEFYVVGNLALWKKRKRLVGNGQCPVLPQLASGAPKVRFWFKGPIVKGNAAIPPGTVIATGWTEEGKYRNRSHGNHAAIYLGQNAEGLQVLDQWSSRDVSKGFARTLEFGPKSGDRIVNGGDYFNVVIARRFLTDWDWAMAYAGGAAAGF